MHRSFDRIPAQVFPFGRNLPLMIDCVPIKMPVTPSSGFHTTRWTLVQAAAIRPTPDSHQALEMLCQTYWHPVYAFVRRKGYDPDQSQDLTQEFFARLLEKNFLGDADRKRGRFRNFILSAVTHFLANEWDRAHALKRGGRQTAVSIDNVEAERLYEPSVVEAATPESVFVRRWALSILEKVLIRLKEDFVRARKGDQFDVLSAFLDQDSDDEGYAEFAARMGLSVGAMRMAVLRMRRKYRQLLREEIAETVSNPDEVDEEIRFLMSVLSA